MNDLVIFQLRTDSSCPLCDMWFSSYILHVSWWWGPGFLIVQPISTWVALNTEWYFLFLTQFANITAFSSKAPQNRCDFSFIRSFTRSFRYCRTPGICFSSPNLTQLPQSFLIWHNFLMHLHLGCFSINIVNLASFLCKCGAITEH